MDCEDFEKIDAIKSLIKREVASKPRWNEIKRLCDKAIELEEMERTLNTWHGGSGDGPVLFVSQLRLEGFSDIRILNILSIIDDICLDCFDTCLDCFDEYDCSCGVRGE